MFSTLATLFALAIALPAALAQPSVAPGMYTIRNADHGSYVHSGLPEKPIYAANATEGPLVLWQVETMKGGSTIRNVPTQLYTTAGQEDGAVVNTSKEGKPLVYVISEAIPGTYTIQVVYEDRLWNAEPPVATVSKVELRPAQYEASERWIFTEQHML